MWGAFVFVLVGFWFYGLPVGLLVGAVGLVGVGVGVVLGFCGFACALCWCVSWN